MNNNGTINISNGNYDEYVANYVQGDQINTSQDLSQAAAQIQQLLTQLQNQGASPDEAQQQAANNLARQAKNDPAVMGKLVKWGKSLGDAAAKTTVTEAVTAVVKLALRLSGMRIP